MEEEQEGGDDDSWLMQEDDGDDACGCMHCFFRLLIILQKIEYINEMWFDEFGFL